MTTLSIHEAIKQGSSYIELPDYLSKEELNVLEEFKKTLRFENLSKLTEALHLYNFSEKKIKTIWNDVQRLREECSDLVGKMGIKEGAFKKEKEKLEARKKIAEIVRLGAKMTEIVAKVGMFVGVLTTVTISGPVGVGILGTGIGVSFVNLCTEKVTNTFHNTLNSLSAFSALNLIKKSDVEKQKDLVPFSKKIDELAAIVQRENLNTAETKKQLPAEVEKPFTPEQKERLVALVKLKVTLPHMIEIYADITQLKNTFQECKTLIENRIKELESEEPKLSTSNFLWNICEEIKKIPGELASAVTDGMTSAQKYLPFVKDTQDKSNPQNASSTSAESPKKSD